MSNPDWPGTAGFPALPYRGAWTEKSVQLPFATGNGESAATTPKVFWGTGRPNGVASGKVGDVFLSTDTGFVWVKYAGSGNTGWALQGEGVDPRAYGAKGDNATDDTAALAAAIADTASAGTALILSPGTYLHTGLSITKEIAVYAQRATLKGTAAVTVNIAAADQQTGVVVRGVRLVPAAAAAGAFLLDVVAGLVTIADVVATNDAGASPFASGWAGAMRLTDTNYALLVGIAIAATDGDRWPIGLDVCPGISANRGNVTIAGGFINRATIGARVASGATGVVNNVQFLGTKLLFNGSGTAVGGVGIQAAPMRGLNVCGVHCESYDIGLQGTTILNGLITGSRFVNFGTPAGGSNQIGVKLLTACKELLIQGNEFDSGGSSVGTGISLDATGHADILYGPNRYANVATAVSDAGTGGGRVAFPDPAGLQGFFFKDHVSVNQLSVLQTTPTLGSGNNNDFALGSHGIMGVTADAGGSAVTGISAPNGSSYTTLSILKRAGGTFTLTHQDAGSVAANRIITPTAATITVAVYADLVYDTGSARWRVKGFA